ncbi:transglycosylase domain-containing protein [Streptomyces niveus]|uniref:transglycosylase domain-containing protein n=1 Tax=Streptomyces niveus TaxID=193462 RepID=UPI002E333054|nr:transglycosylase domain-containing protein [Streptomyces niveus]WTA60369.1 transglycosylase domain-containing protein [Streptomyces niveus]
MSEHRRKQPPPQGGQGGGRAAARRAAQRPAGRRADPTRGVPTASHTESSDPEPSYGGRAEARKAAQRGRGGGRRGGGGPGPGSGRARGGPPRKKRIIDYPRHDKDGWQRWTPSWKLVTGLFIGFLGSLLAAATIAYSLVEEPKMSLAAQAQNNVYLWDDGSQMVATGGETNRQIVGIEQIPAAMQNAVISAENKTFREDSGVDPMGIGRAVFNMARGGQTQGGSTITQQFVKNAMLNQEQTYTRKVKELFISIKVGADMEKPEIMEGYLNTSYYGRGAYGIQAAARTYYGKDSKELNPSECAFLATLLKGATYYDPNGNPSIDANASEKDNTERATKRWKWILDEMVKDGHLEEAERAKYDTFPMPDKPKKDAQLSGQVGYLVDLAKAYFINNNEEGYTADDLDEGGFEIRTTFNRKKVEALNKAVTDVYKKNIDPDKRPKTDTHVQFGGASVEPETGKIVAIYGGADATKHFTNNADQTGAQVGSTFKPYVLAAAMRDGVRDPKLGPEQSLDERTLVSPDKSRYNGKNKLKIKEYNGDVWTNEDGKEWLQRNDGDESWDEIDLRKAMKVSANSPFVQLGMDVGIPQVRQAAVDAGLLKDSLPGGDNPSFSIGISDPSAIRMAASYATFADNGTQREPYSVEEVKKKGVPVFKHKGKAKNNFDADIAHNVTDVLKSVVMEKGGTGTSAQLPDGREVAGKTGTTDGNKSAWFVGYTPQLSTAIDMYRLDDNAENKNREFLEMFGTGGQDKIHGASFPADIWQDYMTVAMKGKKLLKFPEPEPIGEGVYGGGLKSEEPAPSESASESASSDPSESASESASSDPSESATTDPTESCDQWNGCEDGGANGDPGGPGGQNSGGAIGGPGTSSSPPPETGDSEGGNGGGWIGGPGG